MSGDIREAQLVLADGTVFEGEALGAAPPGGVATGEVVFNTALTGYQEIITDPSYAGQIITFTYPHIGNYGVTSLDDESRRPFCRGVIVRDMARRHSSWRAEGDLDALLAASGVPAIGGIDTRRLTRHIRDAGSMPGAFGTADEATLRAAAAAELGTDGVDLVAAVTVDAPYTVEYAGPAGRPPRHVVAYDFGIKTTIVRHLSNIATVEVVPRHDTGVGGAGPTARRRLPLQRTRRPRRRRRPARHHRRPARRGAGLRDLPGPPAAVHRRRARAPTSCPSVTTAATTRSAGCRPARSRSPRRTTTTPSTTRRCPPPSRSPTAT